MIVFDDCWVHYIEKKDTLNHYFVYLKYMNLFKKNKCIYLRSKTI